MVLDRFDLDLRLFGSMSVIGAALGVFFVVTGDPTLSMIGVVLVIVSTITFLLAVAHYLRHPESVEPEGPTSD